VPVVKEDSGERRRLAHEIRNSAARIKDSAIKCAMTEIAEGYENLRAA
jgi:hypothetical protein